MKLIPGYTTKDSKFINYFPGYKSKHDTHAEYYLYLHKKTKYLYSNGVSIEGVRNYLMDSSVYRVHSKWG